MDYKIEDDVPIPQLVTKTSTVMALKPGQSVLLPGSISSNWSLVNKSSKVTGRRFTCRVTEGGVRVWRLPDAEAAE